MEVRSTGGAELDAVVKRFLAVADLGTVLSETDAALRRTVPAAQAAVIRGTERLPRRGGFAAQVARTRIGVKVTISGSAVTLRFTAHPNAVKDPGAIDRGRARHLTFGHKPWKIQMVPKGWFSEPIRALGPHVRKELVEAIHHVIGKLRS